MSQDKKRDALGPMKAVTLENDGGVDISFRGSLYAQTSFFEEDTGVLTKQELYATDDGQEAFRIVSVDGDSKQKSSYLVRRQGGYCAMSNGEHEMSLPYEWLMLFTQAIWDMDLEKRRASCGVDRDELSANE
ncbi:hypothetical protein [Desulfocurvus sp. DL9XJH121]